jgi:N-glycosylase/DNA lyase
LSWQLAIWLGLRNTAGWRRLTLRRLEHLEQRVLTSRAYCSFWRAIAEGLRIRVLDLETLIAIQEELGGEKDRAVLPILRRTLEEKRKIQ